jgi:hypothetical protein
MARKPKKPAKLTLHLRLEAPLHERLTAAAQNNNRSLQTEITTRLQASFGLDEQQKNMVEALKGAWLLWEFIRERLGPEAKQLMAERGLPDDAWTKKLREAPDGHGTDTGLTQPESDVRSPKRKAAI